MSTEQLKLCRKLLQIFSDIMFVNGYGNRFMLAGGTLAGSFHHHDLAPWEDEVSLLVDITIRNRVRELVKKLTPSYSIVPTNETDKFFTRSLDTTLNSNVKFSQPVAARAWSWPYIDISYYVVNKTHVSEFRLTKTDQISWPIGIVFPLHFRPLGPGWYPAPRDPLRFLRTIYGDGIFCKSRPWSHALERPMTVITTRCHSLVYRYPFVFHDVCDEYVGVAKGDMALSMERLVNLPEFPEFSAVHGFCLAAPVENTRAETYFYDYRNE
ncbi:unnamed protein product [Calicophoron daubneyi]|uniref:Uncharacterized protein n=1 Tax=Calicophoron daubneyi TaxID=300641 RepID=A0AAV2TEF3_CALDB